METEIPEKRIIGPKPLDHVPGFNSAPEIGIPVSAAIPLNPDNRPNLSLATTHGGTYRPPIRLIGEIIAQQTVKRLMNPPLTKP